MESEDGRVSSLSGIPPRIPIRISRPGILGRRRRKMVLMVALIGLASFASPMIKTDSQVLGRTQWSPLQVAIGLYQGTLPDCRENAIIDRNRPISRGEAVTNLFELTLSLALGFGTAYITLLAIALASLIFPRAAFVGVAAGFGAYVGLRGSVDGLGYLIGHRVDAGPLVLVFLLVFGALIWIAATRQMDY